MIKHMHILRFVPVPKKYNSFISMESLSMESIYNLFSWSKSQRRIMNSGKTEIHHDSKLLYTLYIKKKKYMNLYLVVIYFDVIDWSAI